MADDTLNNSTQAPVFSVLTQYLKDFSFESPNAPHSLRTQEKMPEIEISINVNANPIGDDNYDVVLLMSAKAGDGKDMLFHLELQYGGVFHVQNIPEEHLMPLVFIEGPRILFPFARQIVAEATRNGGFPPLMIDPIDFAGLFQKRLAEEEAKSKVKS